MTGVALRPYPPAKFANSLMQCVAVLPVTIGVLWYGIEVMFARIVDAINAIPLHLGANDENASENHRLCPYVENSWCRYQLAKWQHIPTPHHPNYLSEHSVNYIQDIFANYGYNKPDFVRKICDGRTSNNNESLHHVLFQMVKKTEQVSNTVMRWVLHSRLFDSTLDTEVSVSSRLQIPVNHDLAKLFTSFDIRRSRAKLQTDTAIKKGL